MYHKMCYHVFADDTQLYISFKCKQPCDLSSLSVNVGESIITQSSKVRDFGVIFDQFLNFDDHNTDMMYKSTFSY